MALLRFSQCVAQPNKVDIDTGTAPQRTVTITCSVTPAGATADVNISIQGGAQFESPILGSSLPLQRLTVDSNGEIQRVVTLKKKGDGGMEVFATIDVVMTEVPAAPGALVAPPQKHSAVIRIRT